MNSERREYPRLDILGVVEYSGGAEVDCSGIKDISRGGIRLVLTGLEPPGSRVRLGITIGESDARVDMTGQIVWARQVEPYEVGIRFVDLDPEQAEQLDRWLED